jgi:hypothetical protein
MTYHGEGGRASAVLGLDYLIPAELDAVGQLLQVVLRELGIGHLGQQGENGGAGVASDHIHNGLGDVEA